MTDAAPTCAACTKPLNVEDLTDLGAQGLCWRCRCTTTTRTNVDRLDRVRQPRQIKYRRGTTPRTPPNRPEIAP